MRTVRPPRLTEAPSPRLPSHRVTWGQVHRFRLRRHGLIERRSAPSLLPTISAIGGAQAQVLSAAELSAVARLNGLTHGHITRALERDRSLVRAWCMRQTLFLVASADLALFTRGTQRRADREPHWMRTHGVSAPELERLLDAVADSLLEPLTRTELATEVARRLGRRVVARRGSGWGSNQVVPAVKVGRLDCPAYFMLHLLRHRVPVCFAPAKDGEAAFVRADAWIPGYRDLAVETAEEELLRRYLGAYGPARPVDFARWAGFGSTAARSIWSRIQGEVTMVDVEGWSAGILTADLPVLGAPESETGVVRLLPYFDSYLLGHEERTHLVEPRHHRRIYRPQGWIAPTLLVDGRVAGVWKHEVRQSELVVTVTGFGRLSSATLTGARAEADRFATFLDCERTRFSAPRGTPRSNTPN